MSWQPRNRGREPLYRWAPFFFPFCFSLVLGPAGWHHPHPGYPPHTLVNPPCHQPHSYPWDVLYSMSPKCPMVQGGWHSAQIIMITKGNAVTRPGLERPDVNGPQSTDESAEWMDTDSTQWQVQIIRCIGLNPLRGFADSRQIGRVHLQHPVISPKPCMCQFRQEMACLACILYGGGGVKG